MTRRFTPYESNLLLKYGFDLKKAAAKFPKEMPVEYIIKIAQFFDYEFYVNQNTLIPRIETEYLVELGLNHLINNKIQSVTFADVGTGSGAIGLTFALELQKRKVGYRGVLSDISAEALKIAEKNLKEYENILNEKLPLRIIKTELLRLYPYDKFDIIFANLPYIPSKRMPKLPISVREYEPLSALDGGEDGLQIIREFLNQAKKHLTNKGIALLEVDDSHDFTKTLEFKNDWEIEIKNDFNGKNRFWVAKNKL